MWRDSGIITELLVLALAVASTGCVGTHEESDASTHGIVLAAGDRVLLAIEEKEGVDSVGAIYRGQWDVLQVNPYRIEVRGRGEVMIRGNHFSWDGQDLVLYSPGERRFHATELVTVGRDGQIKVSPPFS